MTAKNYLEPIEITENDTADENGVMTSYLYDITSYVSRGNGCVGIVAALASRSQQNELDLPPLGGVIDANALDRLLQMRHTDNQNDAVSVTFTYEAFLVTVSANGTVLIRN